MILPLLASILKYTGAVSSPMIEYVILLKGFFVSVSVARTVRISPLVWNSLVMSLLYGSFSNLGSRLFRATLMRALAGSLLVFGFLP